jgi:hypothetical protein
VRVTAAAELFLLDAATDLVSAPQWMYSAARAASEKERRSTRGEGLVLCAAVLVGAVLDEPSGVVLVADAYDPGNAAVR